MKCLTFDWTIWFDVQQCIDCNPICIFWFGNHRFIYLSTDAWMLNLFLLAILMKLFKDFARILVFTMTKTPRALFLILRLFLKRRKAKVNKSSREKYNLLFTVHFIYKWLLIFSPRNKLVYLNFVFVKWTKINKSFSVWIKTKIS